jgi:hypothetical protein
MTSAGAITRKIKKQLRENGMGDLAVRTSLRSNDVWLTSVFTDGSAFTELDVLFAFQGWHFQNATTSEGFVSLTSPRAGI